MLFPLRAQNNNSLISIIDNYRRELANPTLKYFRVQEMADHLGEILQDNQEFYSEIIQVLDQIEVIEEMGRKSDQKLLMYFHKLDLELKVLELQMDTLIPSTIEQKLKDLEIWLQSLQKQNTYQDEFFKKEIEKLSRHLYQLMFTFHFPLYEKIKNKDVDLLKAAMDLFLNRIQSVQIMDLAFEKKIEKKIGKSLAKLMKDPLSRRTLIPHFIVEYIYSKETAG